MQIHKASRVPQEYRKHVRSFSLEARILQALINESDDTGIPQSKIINDILSKHFNMPDIPKIPRAVPKPKPKPKKEKKEKPRKTLRRKGITRPKSEPTPEPEPEPQQLQTKDPIPEPEPETDPDAPSLENMMEDDE